MLGMTKKFCVVTGGGQRENFDLLGESENVSPKSKMMSKAAAKAGAGGRHTGGR